MSTKTKKILIKLWRIVLIVFAIANIMSVVLNTAYATGAEDNEGIHMNLGLSDYLETGAYVGLNGLMLGIPWTLFMAFKLFFIVLALVLEALMSGVYFSLEEEFNWITLKDIIFAGSANGSKFLDVNFFDMSIDEGVMLSFRQSIAKWYYILRLVSAAILLVILIYVGIRMALSTIAQEQAKYKQMLIDWATSLALLFVLHYIIIFTITINSSIVNALSNIKTTTLVGKDSVDGIIGSAIRVFVWSAGYEGALAAGLHLMMVAQIFTFFWLYVKRLITVGFLIMIAPLISITYSIDKIGDGKAQALNTWLKELVYNILLQPFHCIIYLAFYDAIGVMIGENSAVLGAYIFAIATMMFMKKAEDLLRKIFHFEASSTSSIAEASQNVINASGNVLKGGMAAGRVVANFKAAGGVKKWHDKAKEIGGKVATDISVNKAVKDKYKQTNNGSLEGFKAYKQTEAYETAKKTTAQEMKQKADEKAKQKEQRRIDRHKNAYARKHGAKSYDDMVEQKARENYDAKFGPGKYDQVKQTATKRDKNGNLTSAAKKAQAILDKQLDKADKELMPQIDSSPTRTIKNAWAKTGGKAFKNMRKYIDDETLEMLSVAAQDTTKVAASLGMAAIGLGMSGEMNDAISMGQFGYGFAKGAFENSTGTIIKQTTDYMQKLQDIDPSLSKKDIMKLLNEIFLDGENKMFDKLSDEKKKLVDELNKLTGGQSNEVREMMAKMAETIAKKGADLDIEDLLSDLKLDDDDRDVAVDKVTTYARRYIESLVYRQIQQGDAIGLELDTIGGKVEKEFVDYEEEETVTTTTTRTNPNPAPQGGTQQNSNNNNNNSNNNSNNSNSNNNNNNNNNNPSSN